MFGIGGGIINGPLMLALGCLPEVASGTSATMILFTSSTATISFVAFDMLRMDYGVACLVSGFIFTVFGQVIVNRCIERSNRRSLIALSMGSVTGLSVILMSFQSMKQFFRDEGGGGGGIC